MKLDWILIAEGFGTSASGAVTAIGVNQQVVLASSLPATTKRGVMAHFVDESGTLAGQEVEVTLTIYAPSGAPILAHTAPARMNETSPWPELPSGMDVFLEVPLRLSDYGAYEVALSVKQPKGEPVEGRVSFYVREPPTAVLST